MFLSGDTARGIDVEPARSAVARVVLLALVMHRTLVSLGAAILLFAPHVAAQDLAAAEALFNKGLADMEAGRYAEGCSALAESQRLDPMPGTLFTLAECQAKAGKTATAVALYEDYLRIFARLAPEQQRRQRGRDVVSIRKIAEISPHVPKLTIALPSTAPAETVVTRDDAVLNPPALGIPLPVDPGEHSITTRVPDGALHRQAVVIGPDEEKTVELEVLPVPDRKVTTPPTAPMQPQSMAQGALGDAGWRRPLLVTTAGVAIAGLAVGGVAGALVFAKKSTIDENCGNNLCNPTGLDAASSARTLGAVSTVGFGVGLAGLAAFGAMFLFDVGKPHPPVAVGVGPTSFTVKGAF